MIFLEIWLPSSRSNWLENRIKLVVVLGLIPDRNDYKRRTFLWRYLRYLTLYQLVMVMLDQLDQPISLLETSPLLNLKYALDCDSGNHVERVLPPGIRLWSLTRLGGGSASEIGEETNSKS